MNRTARVFGARAAFLLAGLLGLACESPDAPGGARLFTLFDIAQWTRPALPDGFPFQVRYTRPGTGGQPFTINVTPSFSEGEPAAYITTEFWLGLPKVRMQPMYVVGTEVDGVWKAIEGQRPIFPVGPKSAFYSPFWQMVFVTAPTGTPPNQYRTSAQIFADRLPRRLGPGRLCVLTPDGVDVTGYQRTLEAEVPPRHPWLDHPFGQVASGSAWVDGHAKPMAVLDLGTRRFRWDEHRVVEESAIFAFGRRDGKGVFAALALPTVGGTGPLFSQTPARIADGVPSFGALWHAHQVELPASAGAIAPSIDPAMAEARRSLMEAGLTAAEMPASMAGSPLAARYLLRAVLDARCFAQPDPIANCVWLDSQRIIETRLAPAIRATNVLVTCPFLSYEARPVPP